MIMRCCYGVDRALMYTGVISRQGSRKMLQRRAPIPSRRSTAIEGQIGRRKLAESSPRGGGNDFSPAHRNTCRTCQQPRFLLTRRAQPRPRHAQRPTKRQRASLCPPPAWPPLPPPSADAPHDFAWPPQLFVPAPCPGCSCSPPVSNRRFRSRLQASPCWLTFRWRYGGSVTGDGRVRAKQQVIMN